MNKWQKKKAREDYGDILVDVGKLIFAGVVLGGILGGNPAQWPLIIISTLVSIAFVVSGESLKLKNEE